MPVDVSLLRKTFRELYGAEPRLFRAPGRVNLIGEHTDYNDGFVLPAAIERETVVALRARPDRTVRVHSLNLNQSREFDLDRPGPPRRRDWLDYIEGVAQALIARGARLSGADLAILSDVPEGAGLSSSAALEISTGLALLTGAGAEMDRVQLALAGQQAEHTYVGTMCGIMDQYIAALGQAGNALLIDCRTLEAKHIPLDTRATAIVICDSRVKHELASSEYNTRRAECERGVELLRQFLPDIRALRDVSVAEFESYGDSLPEPIKRRCRHVVTENERTLRAAEALAGGDLAAMGRLMAASHQSLRDDYEVSCAELDTLVDAASALDGVYGARMTGGGFGGCTVNLVDRGALPRFHETVTHKYLQSTGLTPHIYTSAAAPGAGEIQSAEG